jgi:hypothetical protein
MKQDMSSRSAALAALKAAAEKGAADAKAAAEAKDVWRLTHSHLAETTTLQTQKGPSGESKTSKPQPVQDRLEEIPRKSLEKKKKKNASRTKLVPFRLTTYYAVLVENKTKAKIKKDTSDAAAPAPSADATKAADATDQAPKVQTHTHTPHTPVHTCTHLHTHTHTHTHTHVHNLFVSLSLSHTHIHIQHTHNHNDTDLDSRVFCAFICLFACVSVYTAEEEE